MEGLDPTPPTSWADSAIASGGRLDRAFTEACSATDAQIMVESAQTLVGMSQAGASETDPYSMDLSPQDDIVMDDQDSGGETVFEDAEEEFQSPPDSPHQYARFHRLSGNYMLENLLDSAYIPFPPDTFQEDLEDPPQVPSIATLVSLGALAGTTCHERWDVEKETAGFLASVLELAKDDGSLTDTYDYFPTYRDFKLELPVLKVDHDTEMAGLRKRNQVTFTTRGLEHFVLDYENDESLLWPTRYLELRAKADQSIQSERLEVDVVTMRYLKDLSSPEKLSEKKLVEMAIEIDKVCAQSLPQVHITC